MNIRSASPDAFRTAISLGVLFCLALWSGSCSMTVTPGQQVDDAAITARIKAKLAAAGEVNPFNIDVNTNEGVVTLQGRVEKAAARNIAEQLARETEGVLRVVNLIKVGEEVADKPDYVRVLYGTNRRGTRDGRSRARYGASPGPLEVGYCDVSIPPGKDVGDLASPPLLLTKLLGERAFNPNRHVTTLVTYRLSRQEFVADLRTMLDLSSERDAFIFIHGFNVTFDEACRRTGQLAHDLKFRGAPLMFSWPAGGPKLPRMYPNDEDDIRISVKPLVEFLQLVRKDMGIRKIHLIAHSMGSRAVVNALDRIVSQLGRGDGPVVSQIVLAAPDIYQREFLQLADALKRGAERTTIYASSGDKALAISREFHDNPRAGEGGENLLILSGIDSIDATPLDLSGLGHSAFEAIQVVSDLSELLRDLKPPAERLFLDRKERRGKIYWVFKN